jgi:6-phosphogluconate dehydrogenase
VAVVQIGMVGLGRMGAGLARRLLRGGHAVVGYDPDEATSSALAREGVRAAPSLEELVAALEPPRTVWVMVPAGAVTDKTVSRLADLLGAGDILIDGGNSNHRDSVRRAGELAAHGIRFLDVGTSGGVWGLGEGFCLMVGGEADAFRHVEPALATLAPEHGYAHVGAAGAGHFTKMVHNGIEYGMLQSIAEGFELLHASDYGFDLAEVAELWRHGSVVRSWLLDLAARAYAADPELAGLRGYVEDSGEGRWTVQEAIDHDVPAPVLTLALQMRLRSRQQDSYAGKVVAALRNQFGGHATKDTGA